MNWQDLRLRLRALFLRHRMEEKECFGCGRAAPELRGFIRIFRLPFRVDRIDLAL